MYKHSPLSGSGYNRLVDFRAEAHSPRSNIKRGINICIICKSTGSALENALTLPIVSGYIATFTELLRSIFWVDNKNSNPRKFSFVFNKLSQLKKTPRMVFCSLGFSNRCATPNTFEVFNRYIGVCAFSFCYDFFTNLMVKVSSETRLFFRYFF